MKRKAIPDLAQLSDKQLFLELETGLSLCAANAQRIEADAALLFDNKRERGARILRLAAEEEAAKVLILLDVVRCPRNKPLEFSSQLKNFTEHLAKGIYAQYCNTKPLKFEDVREWVELERKQFYLDGPNGVDWIFDNDILRRREDTIYVDYYESDDERKWHDPMFGEGWWASAYVPSFVLRLTSAMSNSGWLKAAALAEIATIWRKIEMHDGFSWRELRALNCKTLETVQAKGLLVDRPADDYAIIANEWLFPLWSLDVRRRTEVDQKDLRQLQENWAPVW